MQSKFFQPLPSDMVRYLSRYLHLNGPRVKLIHGEPTEAEKEAVMAVALDDDPESPTYGEPDPTRPDLAVYHLISYYVDDFGKRAYKIGFCTPGCSVPGSSVFTQDDAEGAQDDAEGAQGDAEGVQGDGEGVQGDGENANDALEGGLLPEKGALVYRTKALDEKSALLRYALIHPEFSKLFPAHPDGEMPSDYSNDRLLLKYMEQEVKAAGGLTCHHLRNRMRLSGVHLNTRAWMNAVATNPRGNLYRNQLFSQTIQESLLEDALHHLAYGEIDEARSIFELNPKLLLSYYGGSVTDCSPELHFPKVSAFQFALVRGNWLAWEMMVDIIEKTDKLTDEERVIYKQDFLNQLNDWEENGVAYRLDNLLSKVVRIIDAATLAHDPAEEKRFIDEVLERNAYHLNIKTELAGHMHEPDLLPFRAALDLDRFIKNYKSWSMGRRRDHRPDRPGAISWHLMELSTALLMNSPARMLEEGSLLAVIPMMIATVLLEEGSLLAVIPMMIATVLTTPPELYEELKNFFVGKTKMSKLERLKSQLDPGSFSALPDCHLM